MEAKHWLNLVEMFFAQAERLGDAPFLWQKHNGHYESVSWKEAAKDVARLAWALRDMGVEKGDRVVLVSESRTEWPISDLAIMACGAISVPTYITNTTRDHTHILENSGAKTAIVIAEYFPKPECRHSPMGQCHACQQGPNGRLRPRSRQHSP